MDFSLTEAQRDLATLTRDIADALTHERLRAIESEQDRFDRTLWTQLAEADLLGIALPESVSGSGLGLLEQCSVLIELGRAVAPVPYVAAITQAASAVARFGDDRQRAEWAVPAVSGDTVLTAALAEETGDDPAAPGTTARRDGSGWRLSGTKTAVPAGGFADLILVPATTVDGLTVFLVTPSDEGVVVVRQRIVDLDSEAMVELVDVALGPDRVLGTVGGGAEVVEWLVTQGTIGLCAQQLGVAERALELTTEYARTRVQFDRPIGSFQAVAGRLADAYIDVEAIRLTLWQAAWRVAEGLPAETEVATAKFWAAEAGHRVAHTAVHVHGGMGIDLDHPLHRYFVAAKRIEFTLGGATVQLRRIGTALADIPA